MPTYEYRCSNGHEFERFYRTISSAPSEERCPECGVVATRKISAGGGLLFKGSGFYLTDYGKNAHRKPAPESKGEGGKSSDAKPASDTPKASGEKPAEQAANKPAKSSESTPKPKKE